ncbi:hypothetical protein Cni_G12153 [Canna indica]|uniref:Uncharacterized protein n=1 Tax=Canna indica TaxID=4628 RepID=A0AAQ3QBW4_9LILI|nr:hypothetical protein Cni_G12153 [Canna indica]
MGGGAMRTAAKAAPLGGCRALIGLSGAVGRWVPKPASASASPAGPSAEGGQSISMASSGKSLHESAPLASVQRPSWEIDDWGNGEWTEETAAALDTQHPAPRIVFGTVPTLEEAKEATSDLNEAIEKVYFTPSTSKAKEITDESTHHEAAILSSMPKHVIQTFSLLQGNPQVQNVVASLASDKNVWDAVMKNEKVVEFYRTHKSIVLPPESDITTVDESVAENLDESSSAEATKTSKFADFVHNVKVKVMEVVSDVSNFIQDFFETSSSRKHGSNAEKQFVDTSVGASLMALAVTTILVVLVKRG